MNTTPANEKCFLAFPALRQPIMIGNVEIKNRFLASNMGSRIATEDDRVNQRMLDYYETKAKGGFGLINVEFGYVEKRNKCEPHSLDLSTDECLPGITALASVIHKHGAKTFIQLGASGLTADPSLTGGQPIGPSAVVFAGQISRAYTNAEIYETIEHFGDAALRAKKAGFDGVDLHGGHGYLIEQFMSGKTNKRTDEFGGGFDGRMRFVTLILENIKSKCGADFPVSMRFDADEMSNGGYNIDFAKVIAKYMEAIGISALNVSRGGYEPEGYCVPPNQLPEGENLRFAEQIKKAVNIPVISGARMNEPFLMESAIEQGQCDMIYLGRVSLADPAIPNKILANELDDIIPCVACGERCELMYRTSENVGIGCMLNPFTAHEGERVLKPVEKAKKVAVVGAGPAGMTAAWIMAKRGHDITLYEKTDRIGGQYYLASVPPFKHNISRAIKNQYHFCVKYGVKTVMNTEVTKEVLENGNYDAVVLATGGTPLVPNIPGIHGENVCTAHAVVDAKIMPVGKLLVIGGGMVGMETAEMLAENYNDVTIVEMTDNFGGDLADKIKCHMFKRLDQFGVKLMPNTKVKSFTADGAICESNGEEITLSGFDSIVLAMGSRPYNPLEDTAKAVCGEVHVVGDANKAADAMAAIESAALLALEI